MSGVQPDCKIRPRSRPLERGRKSMPLEHDPDTSARIVAMRIEGRTHHAIAESLSISVRTVSRVLRHAGGSEPALLRRARLREASSTAGEWDGEAVSARKRTVLERSLERTRDPVLPSESRSMAELSNAEAARRIVCLVRLGRGHELLDEDVSV